MNDLKRNMLKSTAIKEYIMKHVNFKKTKRNVEHEIQLFISKNSSALLEHSFIERIVFGEEMERRLAKAYGFDLNDFKKFLKNETSVGSAGEVVNNHPLYHLLLTSYHVFDKAKTRHEYLMFLAILIFTGRQQNSFRTTINASVMSYTLSTLDNSNDIAKLHTLLKVFEKKVFTYEDNYSKKLVSLRDADYVELIQGMHRRVSDVVVKIAQKYYENIQNPSLKIYSSTTLDAEGEIREMSNETMKLESIIDIIVDMELRGTDLRVLKQADGSNMRKYFQMLSSDHNAVKFIISRMLGEYRASRGLLQIKTMKKEYLEFFNTSRNRDIELVRYLEGVFTDMKVPGSKRNFIKVVRMYYGFLIFKTINTNEF